MGQIKVHEFTTLDGSVGAPMWTLDYPFTPALGEAIGGFMAACSSILLGRRTFEEFAPAWSTRTAEDDPGAPFFNDSPKHVVTSTLQDAEAVWRNSAVLGPYDAEAIRAFKEKSEGDIYISGSGTLVRALLADGLVDELHLLVYPVAVGEGPRLFPEGGPNTKLTLVAAEAIDNGVAHLTYGPAAS